jgi:transcriptional activator of cad operon
MDLNSEPNEPIRMEPFSAPRFRMGEWYVDPASGQISRDSETVRLELRTLRLLLCLAEHAGEVVSIDSLLNKVWSGVIVTPDSVYQAVASLRRVLGDDPRRPTYIATVPRLGYRMVATIGPWVDRPVARGSAALASPGEHSNPVAVDASAGAVRQRAGLKWAAVAILCLVLAVVALRVREPAKTSQSASSGAAAQKRKSIAVLPFLDLTEGMQQEEFADGMTEELIDRLSKIPGVRVPGPTSSFFFKGKRVPIADMAKALGVAYVLDGSVRKSGSRLRVAARLIRVDSGYIVWSETYDRPFDDVLMVQDDIAGEVTKVLRDSIDARTDIPRNGGVHARDSQPAP